MARDNVVLRFDNVSFEYRHGKPILEEVSFSVRRGAKFTLMGQNGAGKTSLFKLLTGEMKPQSGRISLDPGSSVAIARQVIPRDELDLSVKDFFARYTDAPEWELPRKIQSVLEVVHLEVADLEKKDPSI